MMKIINNSSVFILVICLVLAGCVPSKDTVVNTVVLNAAESVVASAHKPVTILVHGTRLPPLAMALIPGLSRQVIAPDGLHTPDDLGWTYHQARLARKLSEGNPNMFPYENMYIFGWSGKLSFKDREAAGERLYNYVKELQAKPEYKNSPFKIITISHGGNVALNMARIAEQKGDVDLHVDQLIILCSPVQDVTESYINSPIFKQVICLYSNHELIQVLDPQGLMYDKSEVPMETKTVFSRRIFETDKPHILQAEVRQSGAPLGHAEFAFPQFIRALPLMVAELEDPAKRELLKKNRDGMFKIDYRKLVKREKKKKNSREVSL